MKGHFWGKGNRKGKGKAKGKDKGKAMKGKGKDMNDYLCMNDLTKNCGFVNFDSALFSEVFDIDVDQQSLWCVPLAVPPFHNPIYAHKPGQGEFDQILYDLSSSPDGDGIMAIGALEFGTIGNRDFICAKVKLSTGQEGWINVAMHDNKWQNGDRWRIYLKVVRVENPSF